MKKMIEKKEKKWKKFEKLVADVQQSLAPQAKVIHNDKVRGKSSNKLRQIDISIRQNVGQYSLFIAIDCKDYKDPVDINTIEEFMGKLKDIGANKGAIVSASGFTDGAKKIAINAGIDLYRLVDTDKHDWRAYVEMPVLCDFGNIKRYQFTYKSSVGGPCEISIIDPAALFLYRENGSEIDTALNLLIHKWNNNLLPVEPGIYEDIKLSDIPTCVKTEGKLYHLDVSVSIEVERNLYFGYLPIKEIKGFKDEQTGGVIFKALETDILDVREVAENWQKIESEEDLAVRPVLTLRGIDIIAVMKIKLPQKQENK